MVINALVLRQIVIDIIVNVIDKDYIALIVIAKIAKISLQRIALLIEIRHLSQISKKQS